ncbi:fimbrial biogenesis chaperone [Methylococcus capsulatus]|uniref:fimbrial biogenesis chaperone n=1 Tax=Methylococcus capsulatus TaxID=414 RepID=UPI001C52F2C4|nr:fimbria/pilus periplasmic chaperone [Methylococcus capsulatus]QXP88861.1 fimbria/pilus periplasmic chaperone [Methylococcus capsulatus]
MISSPFAARRLTPLLAACLCASAQLAASQLDVAPTRIELSTAKPASAVTVKNESKDKLVIQNSVVAWTREGNEDRHTPTRDLIVTPPIATVAPGGSQVLRVGLRRPADPRSMLTYRLFVEEVPPPPQAGFKGVQFALRVSLPVLVQPAAPAPPRIVWSGARRPGGDLEITARNEGSALQAVYELFIGGTPGKPVGQSGTILLPPGSRQSWTFPPGILGTESGPAHVRASTSAGALESDVAMP